MHATETFDIQPTCELSLFSFKLSKLIRYFCHNSGSGCLKDQENYDWTTADLNSELFINSHFNCSQFVQEINSNM